MQTQLPGQRTNDDGTEIATETEAKDDVDMEPSAMAASSVEIITPVHMLVSSKILLMVASPVFKAMLLQGNFREGRELQTTGKLSLPLPDDNPDAMRILMDIIHYRNRQVAKKLLFRMLVHIAILVDKYQLLEVVENYVAL